MMSQHTPGPWEAEIVVNPTTRLAYPWAVWKDGVRIARADSRPIAVRHEEEANARLIAKAPEMLALICDWYDVVLRLDYRDEYAHMLGQAHALLREIEGETP